MKGVVEEDLRLRSEVGDFRVVEGPGLVVEAGDFDGREGGGGRTGLLRLLLSKLKKNLEREEFLVEPLEVRVARRSVDHGDL